MNVNECKWNSESGNFDGSPCGHAGSSQQLRLIINIDWNHWFVSTVSRPFTDSEVMQPLLLSAASTAAPGKSASICKICKLGAQVVWGTTGTVVAWNGKIYCSLVMSEIKQQSSHEENTTHYMVTTKSSQRPSKACKYTVVSCIVAYACNMSYNYNRTLQHKRNIEGWFLCKPILHGSLRIPAGSLRYPAVL